MEEESPSDPVEGDFDALSVERKAPQLGFVFFEEAPCEAVTSWSGETVNCANRISTFLREPLSVDSRRDGDAEIFVVLLKFAVAGLAAGNGDEVARPWFAEEAARRNVVAS